MRYPETARLVLLAGLLCGAGGLYGEAVKTLTPEEAVRLAVERSPAVQAAAAALQSAQADVSAALAPHATVVTDLSASGVREIFGASGGVTVQTDPVSVSVAAFAGAEPGVSVTGRWNLWPLGPGERSLAVAAAEAGRTGAAERLVSARIQAALKARRAYQILQIGVQRTALAREAAAAAQARLRRDEARAAQNAVSPASLLQSRRDEADARLWLRRAEATEAQAQRSLERQVGAGAVVPEPWQPLSGETLPVEAPLAALAERTSPSVLAARRALVLAQTRLRTVRDQGGFTLQLQTGVERFTFGGSPVLTLAVQGGYSLSAGREAAARAGSVAAQLALESARDAFSEALVLQLEALEEKALEIESLQYARDQGRALSLDALSKLSSGAVTTEDLASARRRLDGAQLDLDEALVDYQYFSSCLLEVPGEPW